LYSVAKSTTVVQIKTPTNARHEISWPDGFTIYNSMVVGLVSVDKYGTTYMAANGVYHAIYANASRIAATPASGNYYGSDYAMAKVMLMKI